MSNLINKKIKLQKKYDETQLSKYNKAYKRNNIKIYNYRNELHNKLALYLCKRYNEIILGKFSTKNMISKNKKLSTFNKLYSGAISHDKFRRKLENKCNEYNRKLEIVQEHYTSLTCTNCCNIKTKKELSNLRYYKCINCNILIDRDINAARNMLFK